MSDDAPLYFKLKAWMRPWPALSHQELMRARSRSALKNFAEMAAAFDSGELKELVEAIREGKNHHLMDYWLEQRDRRKPSTEAVREKWSTCVIYARALQNCGIRKGHARELIAMAATKSGAFDREVTAETVRGWERSESEPFNAELYRVLYGTDAKVLLRDCIMTLIGETLRPSYDDDDPSAP